MTSKQGTVGARQRARLYALMLMPFGVFIIASGWVGFIVSHHWYGPVIGVITILVGAVVFALAVEKIEDNGG